MTHVDAAWRLILVAAVAALTAVAIPVAAEAQRRPLTPRPFPAPGEPEAVAPNEGDGTSATLATGQPPLNGASQSAAALFDREAPTEADLGVAIFPSAQFITSYDAGRGQRFHLFGSIAPFTDLVDYYSVVLDDRGRRVYDQPAIHQFETARFRDREMDYRPSVTIKDYNWNGSPGYPNTTPGTEPPAFPTIIQITTLPNSPAATDER